MQKHPNRVVYKHSGVCVCVVATGGNHGKVILEWCGDHDNADLEHTNIVRQVLSRKLVHPCCWFSCGCYLAS